MLVMPVKLVKRTEEIVTVDGNARQSAVILVSLTCGEGRGRVELTQIRLTITLINFDSIIHIIDEDSIVSNVVHHAGSAASLEIAGELGWGAGPYFDSGSVLCNSFVRDG